MGLPAGTPAPPGLLPGWQRRRRGRGAAPRGRARPGCAPPPRARLPPALPPPLRWEPGSARPGRLAAQAGVDGRLGAATARGRARRAPGAAWAARGPGLCSASGSCSRGAALHGASGEPRSPDAGKDCPPPPLTSVPRQPGAGGRDARHSLPPSAPRNLRASPELGKEPCPPPQCQPGWGQGPWLAPLSGRGSQKC